MHCLPDHSLDSVEHQHVKLHQLTSRAIKHRAKRIYKMQSKMLISFDERRQSSSKHTEKLSKLLSQKLKVDNPYKWQLVHGNKENP